MKNIIIIYFWLMASAAFSSPFCHDTFSDFSGSEIVAERRSAYANLLANYPDQIKQMIKKQIFSTLHVDSGALTAFEARAKKSGFMFTVVRIQRGSLTFSWDATFEYFYLTEQPQKFLKFQMFSPRKGWGRLSPATIQTQHGRTFYLENGHHLTFPAAPQSYKVANLPVYYGSGHGDKILESLLGHEDALTPTQIAFMTKYREPLSDLIDNFGISTDALRSAEIVSAHGQVSGKIFDVVIFPTLGDGYFYFVRDPFGGYNWHPIIELVRRTDEERLQLSDQRRIVIQHTGQSIIVEMNTNP